MPGRARLTLPGIPWHIIQRGNNRTACFYVGAELPVLPGDLSEASRYTRVCGTCRLPYDQSCALIVDTFTAGQCSYFAFHGIAQSSSDNFRNF